MLNCSASLAMSTSVLKALPGKLDIKRHSPTHLVFSSSASLVMSRSFLKPLPGKLDITRHSSSILYIGVTSIQRVKIDTDMDTFLSWYR